MLSNCDDANWAIHFAIQIKLPSTDTQSFGWRKFVTDKLFEKLSQIHFLKIWENTA